MIHLYILDYHSAFRVNGLTSYIKELITQLHNYNKITLHFVWASCSEVSEYTTRQENGITNIYFPKDVSSPNDNTNHDPLAARYLAQNMTGKSNVIMHFNWINHCPFAWLLKRETNCKTVLTKHCISWREYISGHYPIFTDLNRLLESSGPKESTPLILRKEAIGYQSIDHIICVSEFAKRDLCRLINYPEEQISVIYNGLQPRKDDLMTPEKKTVLRRKYGFDPSDRIILFAGKVDEKKGTMDLAKAFEQLIGENQDKKIRLIIAGHGEFRNLLETFKKHWAYVTITGNLDKSTLFDFYLLADIGVVPSYVEQCSYSAIEMMQSGLPVVVTDVDGLTEIVPDNAGLKVPLLLKEDAATLDIDILTRQLSTLLADTSLSEASGMAAREFAREHLNAEKMTAATVSLYEKLLLTPAGIPLKKAKQSPDASQPQVSVILICKDAPKDLKDCIDSVLQQSHTNLELLLIDAMEQPNQRTILKIKDKRVNYLVNDVANRTKCINEAIKTAKGKYITIIEPQCIMQTSRLQKQVELLEKESEVQLVGCSQYFTDRFGRPVQSIEYPESPSQLALLMFFRNPVGFGSGLYRTDTLRKLRVSAKYKFCEEYHTSFRLSTIGMIKNIGQYLQNLASHTKNISTAESREIHQNALTLISDEMDKIGLAHNTGELAIHLAIISGQKNKFFNTPAKILRLTAWVDKLLEHIRQHQDIPLKDVRKVRAIVLTELCGISESQIRKASSGLPHLQLSETGAA